MKLHFRLALFFLAVAAIHAEDIKTTDGVILKDATITGNDALGVTVSHSDGIARVAYGKLPEELRKKYNYDPKQAQALAEMERRGAALRAAEARALASAAAAADAKEAAADAADKAHAVNAVRLKGRGLQATKEARAQAETERRGAAQRAAEARALAAAAAAAADAAADATSNQEKAHPANAVRLKGRILQATKEGLLVECKPFIPVASGLASFGGGGGVYAPPDPNGKGRPKEVYGTFWIIGHPQEKSKVDNDPIDINASEDGTYSYTSVDGAERRVKQYKVVKSFP